MSTGLARTSRPTSFTATADTTSLASTGRPQIVIETAQYCIKHVQPTQSSNLATVWRPLEHISARSSKTFGRERKIFGVTCQATRELPFGAKAAAHWSTTRPVEARVCMYPTDRLFLCARVTRTGFDRIRRFQNV